MPVTFVRNLGYQPGVQLNPLIDESALLASTIADQTLGVAMRSSRGRIDRAITVNASNMDLLLGKGEPIRENDLNEAWAQLKEALLISGGSAVVSRLVMTDQTAISWAVLNATDGVAPEDPKTYSYSVSADSVESDFALQIKHLGCYNDGIELSVWVDQVTSSGVDQPSKIVNLRINDASGEALYYFRGSTDPSAKDDYDRSFYLPSVVRSQTDEIEVLVAENFAFQPNDPMYGYNAATGLKRWMTSGTLVTFTEGAQAYSVDDYQDAIDRLRYAQNDFDYFASGGNQSSAFLSRLSLVAFETNRQLRFDVDGELGVEAAISFIETLNLSAQPSAHLAQAFWMPAASDDPSGVNPNGYLGASMLNIAFACRRNATKDSNGMARKNYPVAGRPYPIPRSGLRQTARVTEFQLSNIAKVNLNPVLFDTFSDGSMCVFRDQITLAPVENSLRFLISVVDMSTSIDSTIVRYGKDMINALPMTKAVERMKSFLERLFQAAATAGWIIPSQYLGGTPYTYTVETNGERPYDKMDVRYSLHYDGAVRQITVTQTISKG